MNRKIILGIFLFIVLYVLFAMSTFQVAENQSAVVFRFGKIISVHVKDPQTAAKIRQQLAQKGTNLAGTKITSGTGLHFRIPLVDSVKNYSSMLLTYDTSPRQVITADKKKLIFDNNAQWRIDNPALFEIRVSRVEEAQSRLDDILYSKMNEKVGKIDSNVLITDKVKVAAMQNELTQEMSGSMETFGITVVDIRVKRTDLPQENYESVYNRMITERQRIAAQFRSEGEQEAMITRAQTDKDIMILTSEAKKKAEIVKGQGDAEAAKIYNAAYGKDPAFYEFYNTLETYKVVIGGNTKLVIPSNSPLAKYLFGMQ